MLKCYSLQYNVFIKRISFYKKIKWCCYAHAGCFGVFATVKVSWCETLWNSSLNNTQQFFSYIMARTSLFSMRWWCGSLCTWPTRLIFTVEQSTDRHVVPLGHIFLIPSQPVWFDPIRARTYDLLHPRWRKPPTRRKSLANLIT